MPTGIEWATETWNPVTGCTKVSQGCLNCYAEIFDKRFAKKDGRDFVPWTVKAQRDAGVSGVQLHPERLSKPLHWKKPRRIFVNSMSDLFHDSIDDEFIARVFDTMAIAQHHTFQVLTKRPQRMLERLMRDGFAERVWGHACGYGLDVSWPLPNVWLGVSVENQHWADIRIPILAQIPAAVRFVSCEPILGPVDLKPWLNLPCKVCQDRHGDFSLDNEIGQEHLQKSDSVTNPTELPSSHRFPSMSFDTSIVPTDSAPESVVQPFNHGGSRAVDSDSSTIGAVGASTPVDIPLSIEHASDVTDNARVSGDADGLGMQFRPSLSERDAQQDEDSPDGRPSDPKTLSNRINSLAGFVGRDDLHIRASVTCSCHCHILRTQHYTTPVIQWCITGGESGPNARPMHPDWVRHIRDECQAAGVPMFVKQLGSAWAKAHVTHVNDQKGNRPLYWPEDLRVQEFPAAS